MIRNELYFEKTIHSLLILFLFSALVGCQSDFDSKKWKYSFDGSYPNRPKMVQSVINSDLINRQSIEQVKKSLGNPNLTDTLENGIVEITYYVQESYGWDIDPKYTSNLIIEIDSTTQLVKDIKFMESKDRRSWIEKLTTD